MNVIGRPLTRLDGPAKVTGAARYVAETPLPGLAHAALVLSTIPNGRITGIDTATASRAPGVLAVITHENAPKFGPLQSTAQAFHTLGTDRVLHEGQPIACVVAETPEQAQHAVDLIAVTYEQEPARIDFRAHLDEAFRAMTFQLPESSVGDADAALASEAEVVVDQAYRTANRHHHPMETPATVAEWHGDDALDLYDATQYLYGVRGAVAAAFSLPPEKVRVRNEFVGGGFGGKADPWPHNFIAPLAARVVGRPVRLALTKAQTYTVPAYAPATEQRVTLGARRDGTLVALRHTSFSPTSIEGAWVEYASVCSRSMYACPSIETRDRAVHVNLPMTDAMRAPHEGPGMAALEIAMDELAVQLDMDPVQLRLRNDADADPTRGVPFSSKRLRDCYARGAERFGWAGRNPAAASMHEGNDLIGWGMASATMPSPRFPATARVTITRNGDVLVEAGTQEPGAGGYTVLPQIAADALGVDPSRVHMSLGDTRLPENFGSMGSSSTLGIGSGVLIAARNLRDELAKLAGSPVEPERYPTVLADHDLDQLDASGTWLPGGSPLGELDDVSIHTFGALFAEVRIDQALCIPRVTRMVGVYSVGRSSTP
ncbi:xanthine dehydrogenase family protein molybdopterin-binding subunit [Rhodococcus opacus]|nr:xanthine dehydrogenase family protein molybdopterin-binding subunit [Rhodococcus opacus]